MPAKRAWIAAVTAALGLLILTACDQDLVIKPEFSVNVFEPGPKWPNIKKLTPIQKEVYEKFGRPDNFRVMWNKAGQLRRRIDVEKDIAQKKPLPNYSWVYMRHEKEIVFEGSTFVEKPVNDQLKMLVKYGDPEDVKEMEGNITQWTFYGAGKLYKFNSAGQLVGQQDFTPMGKFQKL